MKTLCLLIAISAALWLVAARGHDPVPAKIAIVPPAAAAAPEKADLDQLQGSWQCVTWTRDGEEDADRARDLESSYLGNKLTLWGQGQEYRHGLVTLDPSRTPKAMNTWDLDGPSADQTNRGIYELSGNTLKICVVLDRDKERPTTFVSEPGSDRLLVIYKRKP